MSPWFLCAGGISAGTTDQIIHFDKLNFFPLMLSLELKKASFYFDVQCHLVSLFIALNTKCVHVDCILRVCACVSLAVQSLWKICRQGTPASYLSCKLLCVLCPLNFFKIGEKTLLIKCAS